MRRYLKIYKSLLRINMVAMTTYRANFINSTISASVWSIFVLGQMLILFNRTGPVFGYTKNELILLAVIYGFIAATFHFFFARSFERLARLMMFGNFDSILLKPLDSQFSVSVWEINYASISRFILGGSMLIYLLTKLSYSFDPVGFGLFVTLIFAGVLILYSLWIIAMSFIIRIPELTNLLEIMYTVNGFSRFPPQMFSRISPFLYIAVLPVVFVASVPLKTILGTADVKDIFSILTVCVIALILSRFIWMRSLRAYTSASN